MSELEWASANRKTLLWIYYGVVVGMMVLGAVLWATGHGNGDPYLTLGFALALLPMVVIWLLRRFRRD